MARVTRISSIALVVLATLALAACAPAAPPSPTAAPSKPTEAPKPAAAPAKPTEAPAAKPVEAKPAASPAVKPAEAKPAEKPATAASPVVKPAEAKPAAKPAGPLAKLKYALPTAPPTITTLSPFFALENGYYQEEGLDVEIAPYNGTTVALRALVSGDADVARVGGATPFEARASGAPVKLIASTVDKGTDVVVVNKSVGSLRDLGGKRWALSAPNEPLHAAALILAKRNGVDPNTIEFVAIGGAADRVRALIANRVDVAALTTLISKPILDGIDAGDFKILTTLAKEFPDLPLGYTVTRDDVIQSRPQILTPFLKAEIKAVRWAQQNPERAASIAVKYIKEVDVALMTRGLKGMAELGVYGVDGGISRERVEKTQAQLVEQGVLKTSININDVAVFQFVDQAVRELGPFTR